MWTWGGHEVERQPRSLSVPKAKPCFRPVEAGWWEVPGPQCERAGPTPALRFSSGPRDAPIGAPTSGVGVAALAEQGCPEQRSGYHTQLFCSQGQARVYIWTGVC